MNHLNHLNRHHHAVIEAKNKIEKIKIECLEQLKGDFEKDEDMGIEFTDLLYDIIYNHSPACFKHKVVKDSIAHFNNLRPILRLKLAVKVRDPRKPYSHLAEREIISAREEVKTEMMDRFAKSLSMVGIHPRAEMNLTEIRDTVAGMDLDTSRRLFDDFNLYITDMSKDIRIYDDIDPFHSRFGHEILLIYADVKRRLQPKNTAKKVNKG